MRAEPTPTEEAPPTGRVEFLPLSQIRESTTNPRRTVKDAHFEDLVKSVREHGVLQPILVRPWEPVNPNTRREGIYELVAGHRRLAAAREALLPNVPAFIRELSNQAALEIQVIENLQRSDLHALEEAQGYEQLMRVYHHDVARIAERIGRSAKYVYDRVKLLQLIPAVQLLFLDDRITAGHAIILARLKPHDQERAIVPDGSGPLFVEEHTLFTEAQDDEFAILQGKNPYHGMKTRSVRELQAWVDEHVRFDHAAADMPDLFPETHRALTEAQDENEKVVMVTHEHHMPEDAREGPKVRGPLSWKSAEKKSCEYAVTGVIVIGAGRGDALKVCIQKEKCKVHWSEWQSQRAERARAAGPGAKTTKKEQPWERGQRIAREQEALEEVERVRRKKACPAVMKAIAEKIAKAPATANGPLAQILDSAVEGRAGKNDAIPRGKTAEDLVRHLAWRVFSLRDGVYQWEWEQLTKRARVVGVDVKKILDQESPVQTSAKAPAKPAKKKRAGKKAR